MRGQDFDANKHQKKYVRWKNNLSKLNTTTILEWRASEVPEERERND